MTQEELQGHIYSAIEKSGEVLRDTLGANAEKSVVVVPVVAKESRRQPPCGEPRCASSWQFPFSGRSKT